MDNREQTVGPAARQGLSSWLRDWLCHRKGCIRMISVPKRLLPLAAVCSVLLLALAIRPPTLGAQSPQPGPAPQPRVCNPASGCVLKENGTNARWWADSAVKTTCGSGANNWLVTYNTNNDTWRRLADFTRIRFYASSWSVQWLTSSAQIPDHRPPVITLCFGGNRFSYNDVMSTWVWIRP